MEQQTVRVTDTFNIEQFYFRIFICLEILVHILQHIFHTYLLGIPHRPDRIKLQTFCYGTFQNENSSRTGAGYQIDSLRMQLRNGLTEHTMMPGIHQSDAVRPYQGSTVLIYRFQNTVFQQSALMCLFTESGGENDKRPYLLLSCKHFHGIRTHLCGNSEYRKFRIGNVLHISISCYTLYFCLFRIHGTKFTGITTINKVTQDSASRLVHIIGCSHHYNTGRTKQLVCYHSLFTLSSGYNVTNIRLLCNPAIGKEKKNRSVIGKGGGQVSSLFEWQNKRYCNNSK